MQGDVATLLRELADFLDGLSGIQLPEAIESTRESLLERSRTILEHSDSLQPYLDMNVRAELRETDRSAEYVSADRQQEQRSSLQHYYETFQEYHKSDAKDEGSKTDRNSPLDNVVLLYAGFSSSQAKAHSAKSGSLEHLRRERKVFAPFNFIWLNRHSWVSLVGIHLLLFANDRESRPYIVIPLRGYKSRAAPDALSRDPRRSEGAFEIYCPGERTFQFIAKNSQEMREWVDAINESLEPSDMKVKVRKTTFAEILELESNERRCIERIREEAEKYQDVLNSPKAKVKDKQVSTKAVTPEKERAEATKIEEAPPLPVRTERRRLPSLPSQEKLSFEPKDEIYDEGGLYHRIEDIKAQREYQNCKIVKSSAAKVVQETYDDVETFVDESQNENPSETYDDVGSIVQTGNEPVAYDDIVSIVQTNNESVSYDDVHIKAEKDKSLKPSKASSVKRSFFERVRNRKESVKRDDKVPKSPISPSPKTPEPDVPCYDDISTARAIQEENYLSPPPPRPIYSRPPTIIKCAASEEIYDDIDTGSEKNGCKGCANVDVIRDYPKNGSFLSDLQLSIDQEHYQVPKSGIRPVELSQPPEETYDDVALSETFKNRPRETPEKSMWSRFGSGKRPKIFDQANRQSSDEIDDGDAQQPKVKQSIQKLFSKVENTFGKATKANGVTQS
ncbi:uncharacterized protein LOC131664007 [Phymastichus coffea]|uniref:uncharacterized protein LOC131664007 n=1 Tax=Phymastichus coffea TaxID=108790 RepID=UPI00273C75ED|nr:uncharacterized protein LOC131664007 [Phymastichus coffea]